MSEKINKFSAKVTSTSVLLKLTVSYLILILLLAITIGLSSFHLSTKNYNKEVIKLNNQLLQQYSNNIKESVLANVEETRHKMILDINLQTDIDILYENTLDLSKISTLYNELKLLVGSSHGKYDGIHIFSKQNNIILSSTLGLEYLGDIMKNDSLISNTQWVDNIPQMYTASSIWMPTSKINYSSVDSVNVISYISTYPSNKSFNEAKGYIRIDINEDYMSSLLKNIDIGGQGQMFLIDMNGNISSHSDNISMPSTIQDIGYESIDIILDSPTFESSIDVNGVETIVSYTKINNYWLLVRAVPVDDFYSVSRNIAFATSLICLAAIIIAAIIAELFIFNIYSPLRSIISKLRGHNVLPNGDSVKGVVSNEYEVINTAIKNYDFQLSTLNKQWKDNIVNLKQNLLRSVINNTITSEDTFVKRMKLIGQAADLSSNYNIMYIKVDNMDPEEMIVHDIDMIISSIISFTQDLSNDATTFVASQLTSNTIAVLVISSECNLDVYLNKIIAFTSNVLCVDVSLSIGLWKETPLEAHESYTEALYSHDYHFFLPLKNMFDYETFNPANADDNKNELNKIYGKYSNCLKSGNSDEAQPVIEMFIELVTSSNLSLEARYECMRHMVSILRDFTKEYYVGESDIDLNFNKLKKKLTDIYEYKDWLDQATYHILELKKNQNDRKLDDIVYNIKQYISQNLADDLSLTRLSEYTTLSNCYLSHIFKETTGINVVDYITEQRMIRAKSLLETSGLNIELVASACGFGTPHYFSKKFKQYFGLTPRSYRIAYGEKRNQST